MFSTKQAPVEILRIVGDVAVLGPPTDAFAVFVEFFLSREERLIIDDTQFLNL